jgi:UDP-glucose:glycoprotein glucosyltransferase
LLASNDLDADNVCHLLAQVAFGRLQEATPEDRVEASTYFYDLPQATERRNAVIFEGPGDGQKLKVVDMVSLVEQEGTAHGVGKQWIYPDATSRAAVSIWLAGDLDSDRGLDLVREALKALVSDLPRSMLRSSRSF